MVIRLLSAAVAAISLASIAQAADLPSRIAPLPVFTQLPAVDGLNGKLELFGGGFGQNVQDPFNAFSTQSSWRATGGAAGSISLPVGREFGVQFDGLVANIGGRFVGGLGGHGFWRDPSKGLLGLYASGTYFDGRGGLATGRIGAEGEAYLGRVTLQGIAGIEFGGSNQYRFGYPFIAPGAFGIYTLYRNQVKTRFFDRAAIAFYPLDNLKLSVGHRYNYGLHAASLEAEYLVTSGPTAASIFAEGRIGQRNTSSIVGGVKIYFGNSDKTLIRRHREDDPVNPLFSGAGLASGGNPNNGGLLNAGCQVQPAPAGAAGGAAPTKCYTEKPY